MTTQLSPVEGPACRECGGPGHEGMTCDERRALLPARSKRHRHPTVDEAYVGDPRAEQNRDYESW